MELKPLYTKIEKQENTEIGLLILEDYFSYPKGKSNLYLVNREGEILWFGKLFSGHDMFVNFKYDLA
jgi:hypothetical protein